MWINSRNTNLSFIYYLPYPWTFPILITFYTMENFSFKRTDLGSPLSSTIVNYFIEYVCRRNCHPNFQTKVLAKFSVQKQYLFGLITWSEKPAILPKTNQFHTSHNQVHNKIKKGIGARRQVGRESRHQFLDVVTSKLSCQLLSTSVYRQPALLTGS